MEIKNFGFRFFVICFCIFLSTSVFSSENDGLKGKNRTAKNNVNLPTNETLPVVDVKEDLLTKGVQFLKKFGVFKNNDTAKKAATFKGPLIMEPTISISKPRQIVHQPTAKKKVSATETQSKDNGTSAISKPTNFVVDPVIMVPPVVAASEKIDVTPATSTVSISTRTAVIMTIYMPAEEMISTTTQVVASSSSFVWTTTSKTTRVNSWLCTHTQISVGYGLALFNQVASKALEGFTISSSDERVVKGKPFIQIKMDGWALRWAPQKETSKLDYEFYRSSLGQLEVSSYESPILQRYLFDKPTYSVYVGLGAQYTKIGGAVSMAGFKFPSSGEGWQPVATAGAEYKWNLWSLGGDYKMMNVRTSTAIPSVDKLRSEKKGVWSVWITRKMWK